MDGNLFGDDGALNSVARMAGMHLDWGLESFSKPKDALFARNQVIRVRTVRLFGTTP